MCVSIPYVGDEPSKLYKEIYEFTGKNRKLTNLIYATALQSWYKEKFSSSDFNSQGELNSSKVIEDLNVRQYIEIDSLVRDTENRLNAVDSSGNPVEYNTVEEIIDKVQNVNSQQDSRVVARIVNNGSKYIISVQPKDDTNYNIYEHYKSGIEQLEAITGTLSEAGFNTLNFSKKSQIALNVLNTSNFPVLLEKLQRIDRPVYLSENQVELLLQLASGTEGLARIYSKFGDKTVKAVKHLLSDRTEVPEDLKEVEGKFTKETIRLLDGIRKKIATKANNINASDLVNKLNDIYSNNKVAEHEDIQKTLKDLYKNWHLDKDTIYDEQKQITSLQEATSQIISSIYNNLQFLKSKGALNIDEQKEVEKKIYELQKKLDRKQYLSGILSFLEEAIEELDTLANIDVELIDQNSFNDIAKNILYAKQIINNYSPTIESLMEIDKLKQAEDLEVSDIDKIKKLATKVKQKLDLIEKGKREGNKYIEGIKDKIFTLTFKYLKERWGEDKKSFSQEDRETLGSFEISLEQVLSKGGDISLNVFDRLLASMTEVSDPVLATFAQSIKDLHEVRDDKMKSILTTIRRTTDRLYRAGSNSEFMFETLQDGTVKIVSEIDYEAFYADRKAYAEDLKSRGIKGEDLKRRLQYWEDNHTEEYEIPGLELLPEITGEERHPVKMIAPIKKYRKALPNMTAAQKEYYNTMMSIKASMEYNLQSHGINVSLFTPVQITSEVSDAIASSSPSEAFKLLKDNFVDKFSIREDDVNYGNQEVLTDANGYEIKQLPIYYVTRLKDQKRVNKDFSKSILAYSAMATNYSVMADHISSLELVKEFLLDREIEQTRGNAKLVGVMNIGSTREIKPVKKKTRETSTGDWLQDIMDTKVYGIRHKKEGTIKGTNVSLDKAADVATAYSSVTGLAVNVPGAIANALVGKLQMIIEAGGSEFFNFKDYIKGSAQYWPMLMELLGEVNSNNKKSKLGLLMKEFDVLDDFYEQLRETGFYKNGVNKIIGNTSLFFLYGMGEHLLHAQGMLACLYHTKVLDKNDKRVSLLDAFDVEVRDNNGELKIKEGFKTLDGKEITPEFIKRQKKAIAYVNRSMHGAFGADEKGLIHQYALGRLIMNFRQWMPAHYARRFNKLHYDATLGDFREGYYMTTARFIWDSLQQIKKGEFDLRTRYKTLDDVQKANIRRAITETMILAILYLLSTLGFGDDPKHRSKAEAMTKYEIKRMLMETQASNPINLKAFINNIYKIFNEPIAAISPARRITILFGIDDLIFMNRVKSGPHEGELVYFRNVERAVPFYDQVYKWWNIDTDNSMFLLFNENN